MVGIELDQEGKPFPPELRIGHQVTLACRKRGVVLRNIADVIVVMPAPAMPISLVNELCQVVRDSIEEVLQTV